MAAHMCPVHPTLLQAEQQALVGCKNLTRHGHCTNAGTLQGTVDLVLNEAGGCLALAARWLVPGVLEVRIDIEVDAAPSQQYMQPEPEEHRGVREHAMQELHQRLRK